jgi:RNA polymerase sigma factor (sigma-70 family)
MDKELVIENTVIKEQGKLFGFIRRRVPTNEDAQDILQEVLYQFFAGFDDIRSLSSITSWLYTTAKNKITDFFRKKKSIPVGKFANADKEEDSVSLDEILPDLGNTPEEAYLRSLIMDEIELVLDELPLEQRRMFILNEFTGMSFKEISNMYGIPVNTLISQKHYAVLYLRERLRELYNEIFNK